MSTDDTKEKANIGQLWAEKSANIFLLSSLGNGGDFFDQINNAIS